MRRAALLATVALAAAMVWPSAASAQFRRRSSGPSARWVKVSDGNIYAGMSAVVAVVVDGFDDSPAPSQPTITIKGVTVKAAGVQPQVRQSIDMINQRITRRVSFQLQYQVVTPRAGTYRLPKITVTQGKKNVTAQPATFRVVELPSTRNMKLVVELPRRAIRVGETVPIYIDWYVRRRSLPRHTFHIPLFDHHDAFDIAAPPSKPGSDDDTVPFSVGANKVALPFTASRQTVGGVLYMRWRFTANVTPTKSGRFKLPGARVVADLGGPFDSSLFKAEDQPRSLEVKPLPASGRPPSFSNAVGTDYSISVSTKRSFVRVGDPIALEIVIRGNGRMAGLILPPLDGPGGLPKNKFTVPQDAAVGEVIDHGAAKRFNVVVRLEKPVTGIPELPFSYFDPRTGAYKTVRSDKIALQVKGAVRVGADDVIGAKPRAGGKAKNEATGFVVTNAQLALSAPNQTLHKATSVASLRPLLYLLYGLPLLLLLGRLFWVRTRERRGDSSAVRKARGAVADALAAARRQPAQEAVADVVRSLRDLARITGASLRDADEVIERLENTGFDPARRDAPVDAALLGDVKTLADGWKRQHKARRTATTAAAVLLAVSLGVPAIARAAEVSFDDARQAYQTAMKSQQRDVRRRGFARAEQMYRELVKRHPDRPELLADWGNAALGANELGIAALAYKRALRLDPDLSRAKANMAWIRNRAETKTPEAKSAIDTLFFWHRSLTVPQRHLGAAIAFAIAMLLLTPWGWRTVLLRRLAVLPLVICAAMLVSVAMEPDRSNEAVVVRDAVTIRAADNPGAPAVAAPLPAGAEATIVKTSTGWTKIKLADGTAGWVQTSTIKRVGDGPN